MLDTVLFVASSADLLPIWPKETRLDGLQQSVEDALSVVATLPTRLEDLQRDHLITTHAHLQNEC